MAIVWSLFLCLMSIWSASHALQVGRGIADVTGMLSEGLLFGYAQPSQDARGLHMRQFSRAFIVDDDVKRVALVVVEVTLISQSLRTEVMERLAEVYGDTYNYDNVMLSAAHSHSTPGGYNTYWIYQSASGGFVNETYFALVDGIVESISKAHDDLQPGRIIFNSGDALDMNINRSPYSYDQNPQEEIDSYEHNVEKGMTMLRFQDLEENDLGMINIFPVHTTSMKNYNHLVSTDNKGVASLLFEAQMNPGQAPGQGAFLAAFAEANEGDASPNLLGEWCDDDFTEQCTYNQSTCSADDRDPSLCNGYGPAAEMFEDTRIIGERQYLRAMELFDDSEEILSEVVDYRHRWANLSDVIISDDGETVVTTCRPCLGYSFAAGASDGPGISPFIQGDTEGIPEIDDLVDSIFGPSQHFRDCHAPKPVLLPSGEMEGPFPWQPEIIPFQLFRIGRVILIAAPVEVTTMAGRRMQNAVREVLEENDFEEDVHPVVMALANGFSSYVVTPEEYQVQRYEGASTIFGQHTLEAYLMNWRELAEALAQGEDVDSGPEPPDLRWLPDDAHDDPVWDETPEGMDYGDIVTDVDDQYHEGDTVVVVFIAGNPRHDIRLGIQVEKTFLEVQRHQGGDDDNWLTEFNDAYWETRFYWDSNCHDIGIGNITGTGCRLFQQSNATITWDIPASQQSGQYRIVYHGHGMTQLGIIRSFTGISSSFQVLPATEEDRMNRKTYERTEYRELPNVLMPLEAYFDYIFDENDERF